MISGVIVTEQEMRDIMRKKLKENPGMKLYLRADKGVPFVYVKKVLRACAESGISDIVFGSFQSEGM